MPVLPNFYGSHTVEELHVRGEFQFILLVIVMNINIETKIAGNGYTNKRTFSYIDVVL